MPLPTPNINQVSNAWSVSQRSAPYTAYCIEIEYVEKRGVLQLPVAADGPTPVEAEIIQLHAPSGRVEVRWTATRSGLPPEVPDAEPPSGSPLVLKEKFVSPMAPVLLENGQKRLYVVSGRYTYASILPWDATKGYPMGGPPYDSKVYLENVLGPELFRQMVFPPGPG